MLAILTCCGCYLLNSLNFLLFLCFLNRWAWPLFTNISAYLICFLLYTFVPLYLCWFFQLQSLLHFALVAKQSNPSLPLQQRPRKFSFKENVREWACAPSMSNTINSKNMTQTWSIQWPWVDKSIVWKKQTKYFKMTEVVLNI